MALDPGPGPCLDRKGCQIWPQTTPVYQLDLICQASIEHESEAGQSGTLQSLVYPHLGLKH